MNKSRTKKVTIDPSIMAELEALKRTTIGTKAVAFTPEQDAILLEVWKKTEKQSLTKWWKSKYGAGSENTLRRRFNYLKGQANDK